MMEKARIMMGKLANGLKKGGFEYILYLVASYCPSMLFSYSHEILVLAENPNFKTRKNKTYKIRPAVPEDADIISDMGYYSKTGMLKRLSKGHLLLVAEKHGRPVAICWFSTGTIYIDSGGSIIDTGSDAIFINGIFIAKEERLKGLFTLMIDIGYRTFANGRYKLYGTISITNRASMSSFTRLGFKPAGETMHIVFAGIGFCYYKYWPQAVPRFHVYRKRKFQAKAP